MHYNFARVHQSLTITDESGKTIKRTPAVAAGVADHVWTCREIAGLLDCKLTHYRSGGGSGSVPRLRCRR